MCAYLPTCMALQVIKYMEDKLRQRDAMTEKLRLKNTTLKGQLQKVCSKPDSSPPTSIHRRSHELL